MPKSICIKCGHDEFERAVVCSNIDVLQCAKCGGVVGVIPDFTEITCLIREVQRLSRELAHDAGITRLIRRR
jgi:hypothetical protein